MKYLIFTLPKLAQNEASFLSWNKIANKFYKYPNQDAGTQQYASPIYHPDGKRVAFPLLDNAVDGNQIEFRGKLSFALNIVDKLSDDWWSENDKI